MKFVTFVAQNPAGERLQAVSVRAFDESGSVVATGEFTSYTAGEPFRLVSMPVGTYSASVVSNGFTFAFPLSFTIPDNPELGEEADNPVIIEFEAESSSVPEGSGLPFRVFGHVQVPSLTENARVLVDGFGVTRRGGPSYATTGFYVITARRVHQIGELPTLQSGTGVTVSADVHGRFEMLLEPNTLYVATIPGIAGAPYFRTGDAGEESNINSLIEASLSVSTYDLVR